MKNIFYLLLIISLSSCSFYKATGQSPYQYTSVSEQIIVEDQFYNEPITYFNYVPTFTFASYYSYYWWRPNRTFYYWMYPTVNYWGSNSWNGWNYHNNWNYTYYPYYLNNWAYYNNLYHPYTYNTYFIHPNQGFSNFNPGCNSPFYIQKTNNKSNYTSQKPQHTKYLSDNSPTKPLDLNKGSYERPKQDLRNYNEQRYNTPSRKTETRTYEKPQKVEYRNQTTRPERPTYQRQERTYQSRPNYERPKSNYRPSNDQAPTNYRPSNQPSRSTYQPRTNYGGSRGNSPSQRSNFGVKGGR